MKGKILVIQPEGPSSVYRYVCQGDDGLFSFPVEWRYHVEILEREGNPAGREIECDDLEPPMLKFLD